jgi:hypothetical protein
MVRRVASAIFSVAALTVAVPLAIQLVIYPPEETALAFLGWMIVLAAGAIAVPAGAVAILGRSPFASRQSPAEKNLLAAARWKVLADEMLGELEHIERAGSNYSRAASERRFGHRVEHAQNEMLALGIRPLLKLSGWSVNPLATSEAARFIGAQAAALELDPERKLTSPPDEGDVAGSWYDRVMARQERMASDTRIGDISVKGNTTGDIGHKITLSPSPRIDQVSQHEKQNDDGTRTTVFVINAPVPIPRLLLAPNVLVESMFVTQGNTPNTRLSNLEMGTLGNERRPFWEFSNALGQYVVTFKSRADVSVGLNHRLA